MEFFALRRLRRRLQGAKTYGCNLIPVLTWFSLFIQLTTPKALTIKSNTKAVQFSQRCQSRICSKADPIQLAMVLPDPSFTFTLPSVHDGAQLDCRLYIPWQVQKAHGISRWHKRGAIVAHPYAPLGGCYDDPVVNFIGEELLRAGYVVGTFNFR